ncbi:MAG TPA: hypothetical protein VG603_00125 [Chitinophagales bacterium]|nr:hypothetical protein [Chitinophagales bacterium]
MKSILFKTLVVMLIGIASIETASAGPVYRRACAPRVYYAPRVVPAPRYVPAPVYYHRAVWVPGHYIIGRRGARIWVRAHWE